MKENDITGALIGCNIRSEKISRRGAEFAELYLKKFMKGNEIIGAVIGCNICSEKISRRGAEFAEFAELY